MRQRSGPCTVHCYYCGWRFEVSARAQSTSCPKCNRALMVSDIVVQKLSPVSSVQTCGRVVVKRSGRVIAKNVTAQLGVEVLGVMNADVASTGPVVIGPKAQWKGRCVAPTVVVNKGAQIAGYFEITGKAPSSSEGVESPTDAADASG